MHEIIDNVVDEDGDGHCGLRAVVGLRNKSVDDMALNGMENGSMTHARVSGFRLWCKF